MRMCVDTCGTVVVGLRGAKVGLGAAGAVVGTTAGVPLLAWAVVGGEVTATGTVVATGMTDAIEVGVFACGFVVVDTVDFACDCGGFTATASRSCAAPGRSVLAVSTARPT